MDSSLSISPSKDSNVGTPLGGMLFETALDHIHSLLDCEDFEDSASLQVSLALSTGDFIFDQKVRV